LRALPFAKNAQGHARKTAQVRLSHASATFVFICLHTRIRTLGPDGLRRPLPEWPSLAMSFSGKGAHFHRAFRLARLLTFASDMLAGVITDEKAETSSFTQVRCPE
jgi:hypothetical protein